MNLRNGFGMKYRINPEFLAKSTQDFLVFVSPEKEEAYFSNDVGSLIWQLLKEGYDTEEILTKILDLYEVSPKEASRDLEEFLEELLQAQIIFPEK